MSQNSEILKFLKSGKSVTQLTAISEFGCLRLSARIADLKGLGYNITSKPYKVPRSKKIVAIYKLKR